MQCGSHVRKMPVGRATWHSYEACQVATKYPYHHCPIKTAASKNYCYVLMYIMLLFKEIGTLITIFSLLFCLFLPSQILNGRWGGRIGLGQKELIKLILYIYIPTRLPVQGRMTNNYRSGWVQKVIMRYHDGGWDGVGGANSACAWMT